MIRIASQNGGWPDRQPFTLQTESVPCGVCGKDAPRPLYYEAYELHGQSVQLGIKRCGECGQVYVSPRLDRNSVQLVYEADAVETISHNYCWSGETSDARFGPLLGRLKQAQPSGALLDVGCGNGSFLSAANQLKCWDLYGVDPVVTAIAQAQKRVAAKFACSTLEDTSYTDESFSIVSMLGVLEHLHDPLTTLRRAHRLLQPGGVLAVYVPNFHYLRLKDAGLASWLRDGRWSSLAPQEHLFHFTPNTLQQLLARAGFETSRVDVGRPFLRKQGWKRWLKQTAFAATLLLHRTTRIHMGGLEVLAVKSASSAPGQVSGSTACSSTPAATHVD